MSYRIRRILIVVILCGLFIIYIIYRSISIDDGETDQIDNDGIVLPDYENADTSIVETGEEVTIAKDQLDSLKESMPTDKDIGNAAITPGISPEPDEPEQPAKCEESGYTPGVDWSGGDLSEKQLDIMAEVACKLYEDKLNVDGADYVVKGAFPPVEDLQKFKVPMFYFINDGALILNLKLTIYDMDKETKKEILIPISLGYTHNKVVITEH